MQKCLSYVSWSFRDGFGVVPPPHHTYTSQRVKTRPKQKVRAYYLWVWVFGADRFGVYTLCILYISKSTRATERHHIHLNHSHTIYCRVEPMQRV